MMTEREKEVIRVLAALNQGLSLSDFDGDPVRLALEKIELAQAALDELDRLRAENARLRKDGS